MRYAALQREIGGISQKMLTQTLRSLERDGLVQRTVHPVVPPKVEYSLTRLGRTLIDPLRALCRRLPCGPFRQCMDGHHGRAEFALRRSDKCENLSAVSINGH